MDGVIFVVRGVCSWMHNRGERGVVIRNSAGINVLHGGMESLSKLERHSAEREMGKDAGLEFVVEAIKEWGSREA